MTTPPARGARGRLGRVTWRLGLALLPAPLLGLYSSYPALAFLPYVTLVPWVLLYADDRHRKVSLGYFVLGAYAAWLGLHWFLRVRGWFVPWAMGAGALPAWIAFAPAMRAVHRAWRLPRALTVPLVWTASEWFRQLVTLGHLDLFALGYSQARFPALVQIADVTGVYGVSFLVAAVNGLLADAWFAVRDSRASPQAAAPWPRLVRSASAIAAGFLVALTYGGLRLATAEERPGPRVAVVQPNAQHGLQRVASVHLTQVLLTEEDVPAGGADLIVWPENAILDCLHPDPVFLEDLEWLARRKRAHLLLGAIERSETVPGRAYNVAVLVDPDGEIAGTYRKRLLFLWTESVPFDDLLGRVAPALQRFQRALVRRVWGSPGIGVAAEDPALLDLPWNGELLPFGVVLCHEHIYPPIASETARLGPRFLVNPTSEGRVSGPIQEQMLRISIMRAIENRIPYVRCGNTGISAIVDAQGRVRNVLRGKRGRTTMDAGVLIAEVPLSAGDVTLYARSRDAFAKLCVVVSLGLMLVPLVRRAGGRPAAAALAVAGLVAGEVGCGALPALGDDPDAAVVALERARRLYREGRFGEALREVAAACASAPACEQALPYAADCYQVVSEPELGAQFFRKVGRRHPELRGQARMYEGYFLGSAGAVAEAARAYEEAIALAPSARAYTLLGKLRLRQLGDVSGALEAFERALELDPDHAEARSLKGRAQVYLGDGEGARRTLEQAVADSPRDATAWSALGRARLLGGDEAGALEAWHRAVSVDPMQVEARLLLGRAAIRDGRFEEAERWRRELLKIEPQLEAAGGRRPGE